MALPSLSLSVVNEALVRLGESPLDTLEGTGTVQVIAAALYQPCVDNLLGGHPWTFNRRIVQLNRLSAAPPVASGFSAAFQLPELVFRIVVPYIDGSPVSEWGQAADQLYLDAEASEAVELEHHTRVEPSLWRPAFREAAVLALATAFAVPVADAEAKAKDFGQSAFLALSRARHLNAFEKPAIKLPTGRLDARMRRG